jgi:hypothetical protein
LKNEIICFLKENTRAKGNDVRKHFEEIYKLPIGISTSNRLLKKLGWSWRVPTRFQVHKYTYKNMLYYTKYLQCISEIPIEKLKFVDEAHVFASDLACKRVLGITGKRTYVKEATLHKSSASITLLVSLTNEIPFFLDYRIESNSQFDFANFVFDACKKGFLQSGDYLIADNASIHFAKESRKILFEILDTFGVKVLKLPVYSPELNPCELVFAQIKRYIRNNKLITNRSNLISEIIYSLSEVTIDNLYNYYLKCVCPKVILPEFFA